VANERGSSKAERGTRMGDPIVCFPPPGGGN
jgi:hypothetical protein